MQSDCLKKNKKQKALCCIGLVLCLAGCGVSIPLSERAIVKAVYLDEMNDTVQAVLAVQTCQPSANAGEAQSEMRLYQGEGKSIATAMQDAEQQQNKKPFYAQNRLLFLGEGAVNKGVSRYLSYFGAEEVSRTSLSVFVLPMTAQALCEAADSVELLVTESERMTNESRIGGNRTGSVYEARFAGDGTFVGYLPVLRMDMQEKAPVQPQISELLLFGADKPLDLIQKTELQLALLFAGKGSCLTSYLSLDGVETVFKTQRLMLKREMTGREKDRCMQVALRGKIESVSQNGMLLQGATLEAALRSYNAYLQTACGALYERGFYHGADLFNDTWWFLQEDTQAVRTMQEAGTFYTPRRIGFSAKIVR